MSRVIDCHMHVRKGPDGTLDDAFCDRIVEAGDLLGIDLFCISDYELRGPLHYEEFHAANDRVAAAIDRYPSMFKGYCFVNPSDPRALDEMDQRIRHEGSIGIKLYNQYFIDDPIVEPILRRAAEWQIPVLSHAGKVMDVINQQQQPYISDAARIANAAKRIPGLTLIEAHIGGGGDWEWALEVLADAPTVYLDTSGSVIDEWMVDRAVEMLGVNRVLFGTDTTMEGGVGKILDANLSDDDRMKVLGGNFEAILDQRAVS